MIDGFDGFYRGRRVLVTGHTGFKGSWLAIWLVELGAQVVGYALAPPTEPSHFAACRLDRRMTHVEGDVLDFPALEATIDRWRPEVVLHLAAQPLVRLSYREPRHTFAVNMMGTVNVLEAARRAAAVPVVVVVTSDKCYRGRGQTAPYRETDELGGSDPYSASKACAELAAAVYADARFQRGSGMPRALAVASARAGNCLGGGDWALDRIVPDTIRALASGVPVVVRNPEATRPWQHVLDPLSGYLWLAARLAAAPARHAGAWNFGPSAGCEVPVAALAQGILDRWGPTSTRLLIERDGSGAEAPALRLDAGKAHQGLGWDATWTIEQTLDATVGWYRCFAANAGGDHYACAVEQVEAFTRSARALGRSWAEGPRTAP